VLLSGKLIFPSGFVPSSATVEGYEVSTGSLLASFRVNGTGYYSLPIAPSTAVSIRVDFSDTRFGGYGYGTKTVTSLTLTTDKILNIVIPGGIYNGTVVDVNGAPVGSVTIQGRGQDKEYKNRYFFQNVMTSETGTFSVFLLGLIPYYISFTPPAGARYSKKSLSNAIIDTTNQHSCSFDHGAIEREADISEWLCAFLCYC
jgi:hypothetical protein